MSRKNKSRPIPSEERLINRAKRLQMLGELAIPIVNSRIYTLEPGNKKTGQRSDYYNSVFVWNIPPVSTCPGRSSWCTKYCYNGDDRPDIYPIGIWADNWWGCVHDRQSVKESIIGKIRNSPGKTALRIHSSGDFFSVEYINMWIEIVDLCPDVDFWAYTRSWTVPILLESLYELKERINLQLFASWDDTMRPPPKDWRLSFVDKHLPESKNITLNCPEQYNLSKDKTCASCRYCLIDKEGDVFFVLH